MTALWTCMPHHAKKQKFCIPKVYLRMINMIAVVHRGQNFTTFYNRRCSNGGTQRKDSFALSAWNYTVKKKTKTNIGIGQMLQRGYIRSYEILLSLTPTKSKRFVCVRAVRIFEISKRDFLDFFRLLSTNPFKLRLLGVISMPSSASDWSRTSPTGFEKSVHDTRNLLETLVGTARP